MANASIKALRGLLRGSPIPIADLSKHVKELTGNKDRLVAIVCASMVELAMTHLVKSVMTNGPGLLFEAYQPLSAFSAKIDLCYSLGLIDDDIRKNEGYMREIRNVFAHRIAQLVSRLPEVGAVCKLFKLGAHEGFRISGTNMRSRYLYAAIRTGAEISARALKEHGSPPASLPEKHRTPRPAPHPSDRQN